VRQRCFTALTRHLSLPFSWAFADSITRGGLVCFKAFSDKSRSLNLFDRTSRKINLILRLTDERRKLSYAPF